NIPNNDPSVGRLLNFALAAPVTLPNTVWVTWKPTPPTQCRIVLGLNTLDSGDMGYTADRFTIPGWHDQICPELSFNGNPYAGFWVRVEGVPSRAHPCWDLMTGNCSIIQPAACSGQLRRPAVTATNCQDAGCTGCAPVTPSGTPENEPVCTDGYADVTNAGCN